MTQSALIPALNLKKEMRSQARLLRETFLAHIRSPEFWDDMEKDPEIFHEALNLARDYAFVHYTRVAAVMKMKDASAASRWFATGEGRKTPEWVRRQNAIQALTKIVANDVKRLRNGQDTIGQLSVKEHPALEVTLFDRADAAQVA